MSLDSVHRKTIPMDIFLNVTKLLLTTIRPKNSILYVYRRPFTNMSHTQMFEIWEIEPSASLDQFLVSPSVGGIKTAFQMELFAALGHRRKKAMDEVIQTGTDDNHPMITNPESFDLNKGTRAIERNEEVKGGQLRHLVLAEGGGVLESSRTVSG